MISGLFFWICVCACMTTLAMLWVAYLIRIVLNEEVVQERRRRRARKRELERRAEEDRQAKRVKK